MKIINRGYCGIGVYNIKNALNVGTLWRSAYCLGADFIFTVGRRYRLQSSDTYKAYCHIPLFQFPDLGSFHGGIPYDCQLVGVEIEEGAKQLIDFVHPQRCVYLLGPEDGSIPKDVLARCQHIVKISSRYCLNVASAGSIVLYDRMSKAKKVLEKEKV